MKFVQKVATIALVAFVASACSIRPPRPPDPPQPPPPIELTQLRIFVHEQTSPTQGIPDVSVVCTTGLTETTALTAGDGWVTLTLQSQKQTDCSFTRADYQEQTASAFSGVDQELDVWMVRIPPAVPVSRNQRVGTLELRGDGFYDGAGPVNPLYAHFGDALALWVRDAGRVLGQLNDVASAGYQGVRAWLTLGCGEGTTVGGCGGEYWDGYEVGPYATAGYWDHVAAFGQALRDRGLRAVCSQGDIGQTNPDRRGYMRQLAETEARSGPICDFVDGGNEAWQTGEPDANRLADFVDAYADAGGRGIRSLTSPPGEGKEELDQYSIDPAQIFDVHSYRGGHSWDKRRHIFSIPYEGKPMRAYGIGSEPPGNGANVSVTDNKHELDNEAVPLLAVASMYSRQAFVWFSGEGVKLNAGLSGEAGFWTTPTAVDWLPRNTMGLPTLHHGGDSWRGTRLIAASGEARVDCRTDGSTYVCTIDGPSGSYRLPVDKSFTGRLCDAGTSSCEDVARNAGETLDVAFTRGRVLVAQAR